MGFSGLDLTGFFFVWIFKNDAAKTYSEMQFKEFGPRFKSAKTRFKLSAGLNLKTLNSILSGTNHILAAA